MKKILLFTLIFGITNFHFALVKHVKLHVERNRYVPIYGDTDILAKGVKAWNEYVKTENWKKIRRIINYFLVKDEILNGINFSNFKLCCLRFVNVKMKNSNFYNADIKGYLERFYLKNCDFSNSDFRKASIRVCTKNCSFKYANFQSAKIYSDQYEYKIENCTFNNANFKNSKIYLGLIKSCNFNDANFKSSKIGISIPETLFLNCNFINADFHKATFNYSKVSKTKVTFKNCNFIMANLFGVVKLNNAKFINCNFTHTKVERKWYNYLKTQKIKNFDKITWVDAEYYKIKAIFKKLKSQIYSGKAVNIFSYERLKSLIKIIQKKYPYSYILKSANALIEYLELKLF